MISIYIHSTPTMPAPGATPNAILEDHFTHASSGDLALNYPDLVGTYLWGSESGLISYLGSGVVQTTGAVYKIESGHAPTLANPITTQVSVRGGAGSYAGITYRQADGANYFLAFIYFGGAGWEIDAVASGQYGVTSSGAALYAASTWHQLKVVDDGNSQSFYVNGSLVQTAANRGYNTNSKVGIEGGLGTAEFKDFVVTRAP